MGGWGCPHDANGICQKVVRPGDSTPQTPCDPGMKGCVLAGRFRFSSESKNRPEGIKKREFER
ncbi:MAG: hypothetical protein HN842_00510 [Gammaproteobacteria bacterium]|jgi:hypothetical protein|nr:hypothetical protein [Gammaproteobacteria bacterium]MBT7306663.1 hypothetical protein [Gammaproteobacteria bacterium]